MALIVQKYGGTSVGSVERIGFVADKIVKARARGDELVVVVSAMAGETDRLVQLAQKISESPDPREFDVLLSTGEQASMALLCLALLEKGCPARSYTGMQAQIRTDNAYNKARILGIDASKIKADLSTGKVVVIAGFQGVDDLGNITTLGRGGSDTTAVALAAALKADECHIYTDVDGVYTADPRVVLDAKQIQEMAVAQMLEMSGSGMKAVQDRAMELAAQYDVPVRVLSTFQEGAGTLITKVDNLQHPMVSSVTFNREEARVVLYGVPFHQAAIASVLGPVSNANIEVDMIVQTQNSDGRTVDIAFTVHRRDYRRTLAVVESIGAREVCGDDRVSKLALIGMGMRSYASIIAKILEVLGVNGINIQLITTSETKISVIIEERFLELGIRELHKAFELSAATREGTVASC